MTSRMMKTRRDAAHAQRPEVQSHPLVDRVFDYARVAWEDVRDTYMAEMPVLMQVICEACTDKPLSASGVYYYMRKEHEATALDVIQTKEHKVVTLARLMSVMAGHGILETSIAEDTETGRFTVYQTLGSFRRVEAT